MFVGKEISVALANMSFNEDMFNVYNEVNIKVRLN
jgi:hypothetical protein